MVDAVTEQSLQKRLKELDGRIRTSKNRAEIIFLRKQYNNTLKDLKRLQNA